MDFLLLSTPITLIKATSFIKDLLANRFHGEWIYLVECVIGKIIQGQKWNIHWEKRRIKRLFIPIRITLEPEN